MKTQKTYAQAMKILGNIDSVESIDELKTAMADIVTNIESHVGALNTEAKTYREAKEQAESITSTLGEKLGLAEVSADAILGHITNIQSTGESSQNDLSTRLIKIENQLKNEINLRTTAEETAKKVTHEKNQQTISSKVSSLLESAKVLPIHRELLTEKLSRDLKLDSDGDITNNDGIVVTDIVSQYVEANKDSGIIQNTQTPGSGTQAPSGKPSTQPTSVRGNIEAFAERFQK